MILKLKYKEVKLWEQNIGQHILLEVLMKISQVRKILKMNPDLKGDGKRIAVLELGADERWEDYYTENINLDSGTDRQNRHVVLVGDLIQSFKPNAEIFLLDCRKDESAKWIMENDIDIVTMSISDTNIDMNLIREMSQDTFIISSAGNASSEGETMRSMMGRYWFQVGALDYSEDTNKFNLMDYSSWSRDEVDGATFSGIPTVLGVFHGTSASSPLYTCLVIEYMENYEIKFNRLPSVQMTLDFIDRHSHNVLLEDEDSDLKLGYGLLVLPEEYHFERIVFTFPSGSHESNDTILRYKDDDVFFEDINNVAKIMNGRTYLPVRELTRLLGIDIEWDNDKRQVVVYKQQGDH